MHRRSILRGAGSTLAMISAGYLGTVRADGHVFRPGTDRPWDPDISATEPVVGRGETASITVDAQAVSTLHVTLLGGDGRVGFSYAEATHAPPPATTYLMYPPAWSWNPETSVAVSIPVAVADDAVRGIYPFAVRVTGEVDGGVPGREATKPIDTAVSDRTFVERRFDITVA